MTIMSSASLGHKRPAGASIVARTYAVLMALASDDGQSQRELSARLGIHRNAMVTVIDNLERRADADRQKRR
jgi:DNA-binding MarR family transcriptional regulator